MNFWQGRRVFITGHTGLRGSWLSLALSQQSAQVFGYSLPPTSSPNFYEVSNVAQSVTSTFSDVRDLNSLKSALEYSQAEIVFHLAGGVGMKQSWQNPAEVYSSQVLGTVNLLESLRETASVRAVVILSSDKVYRSARQVCYFKEDAPLGGSNPSSTAKACTELIVESYLRGIFSAEKYHKHKVAIATARLGAVIGGGDFALDSLMYQLAQSVQSGKDVMVKNPNSMRAWMHVDDAVAALLSLGQALLERGPKASGPWNFGSNHEAMATVADIKSAFMQVCEVSQRDPNSGLLNLTESYQRLSDQGDRDQRQNNQIDADQSTAVESYDNQRIGSSNSLDQNQSKNNQSKHQGLSFHSGLDSSKAEQELGWKLQFSPQQAAAKAAQWYLNYYKG